MASIWTMGELIVEIMRPKPDMHLDQAAEFIGPFPSGAPGIFIDTIARLGSQAGIIGGVGNDDFGVCLTRRLRNDGVDCRFVSVVDGLSTGVAFVTYFQDGSRKFLYHIGNTPAAMSKSPDIRELDNPTFFHVMGCSLLASQEFEREIVRTMKKFRTRGAKISFDPNIRPELLGKRSLKSIISPVMDNCSVFLPGIDELLMVAEAKTIDEAVSKLFKNEILEVIALKRGKDGCTVYTRTGHFSVDAFKVNAIDPTGAGDCFDAGFIHGLASGKTLQECARIATAAGALNAQAFGPMEGMISAESIEGILSGQ